MVPHRRALTAALIAFGAATTASTNASTVYVSENDFMAAIGGGLMESFEGLAATNAFSVDSIGVADFHLTTVGGNLGVYNTSPAGLHPTDGAQFVGWAARPADPSVTIAFESAVPAFGISLTDPLDGGIAGAQLVMNAGGEIVVVTSGAQPSGSQWFIGLVADAPFTTIVLTVTAMPAGGDGIGLDEVRWLALPTSVDFADRPRAGMPTLRVSPNPFTEQVSLSFSVASTESPLVTVYDVRGRLVRALRPAAGGGDSYAAVWDACDQEGRAVPTGVYFVRVGAWGGVVNGRVMVVR